MFNPTGEEMKKFCFPFNSIYTPVMPCVMDGNLSFIETVWRMLHDLNKTVDGVNANHNDIIQLATEIDNLNNDKLSFMLVELNTEAKPITVSKTYEEIKTAFDNNVFIIMKIGNGLAYCSYSGSNELYFETFIANLGNSKIQFAEVELKSDNSVNIKEDFVITQATGGTINKPLACTAGLIGSGNNNFILGVTTVATPTTNSSRSTATNVEYVGSVANQTLTTANNYADNVGKNTLISANNNTTTKVNECLTAAKAYADEKDGDTLTAAKTFSNNGDIATLTAAKEYADKKIVVANLTKNNNVYSVDIAFKTMQSAINNGNLIIMRYDNDSVRPSMVESLYQTTFTETQIIFVGMWDGTATHICKVNSDGTVVYS